MQVLIGSMVLFGLGKLLFGRDETEDIEERKKQTIFEYPKDGYGLDDDPVLDELFFLDIMEWDD